MGVRTAFVQVSAVGPRKVPVEPSAGVTERRQVPQAVRGLLALIVPGFAGPGNVIAFPPVYAHVRVQEQSLMPREETTEGAGRKMPVRPIRKTVARIDPPSNSIHCVVCKELNDARAPYLTSATPAPAPSTCQVEAVYGIGRVIEGVRVPSKYQVDRKESARSWVI